MPAKRSPPIIPISIKATCSNKFTEPAIEEFKKELLNPIKDLLPGTSIIIPCVKYTIFGVLYILLNKPLIPTMDKVPIKVLTKTPYPDNKTVIKKAKTPVKRPKILSFFRT